MKYIVQIISFSQMWCKYSFCYKWRKKHALYYGLCQWLYQIQKYRDWRDSPIPQDPPGSYQMLLTHFPIWLATCMQLVSLHNYCVTEIRPRLLPPKLFPIDYSSIISQFRTFSLHTESAVKKSPPPGQHIAYRLHFSPSAGHFTPNVWNLDKKHLMFRPYNMTRWHNCILLEVCQTRIDSHQYIFIHKWHGWNAEEWHVLIMEISRPGLRTEWQFWRYPKLAENVLISLRNNNLWHAMQAEPAV